MIKAVLFDFDETLQDRTSAFDEYAKSFMAEFFEDLPKKEKIIRIKDMIDTGNGGYVDRSKYYENLISKWNWETDFSGEDLTKHYNREFGLHSKIFEKSLETLKKFKDLGFVVGVITNGPSDLQHTKLEQSGLLKYCDILVVSGDIGIHKPSPEIFKYTAEKLDLKTKECVYVGDHPINDIEGALQSGMKAIRMNFGWFKNQGLLDEVENIDSIDETVEIVLRMNKEQQLK